MSFGCAGLYWKNDIPVEKLKEKYATSSSQFIEIDKMNVHYRDEGNSTDSIPLVLLHGTGASLHTWEGWVNELKKSHRVITLDLPAYGLTGPNPAGDYSVSFYAEFLHNFLNKIGVNQCIVGGNSLGGYIAWNYALKYPKNAQKLILVDAAGYPMESKSIPIAFQLASLPLVKHLFKYITPRSILAKSIHNVYGDPSKVTPQLIDRYFELSLRPGNRAAFIDRMSKFRKSGLDENYKRIPSITIPTLIIWGEKDLLIPVSVAERFHNDLPHNNLVLFTDLGHTPMEEDPINTVKPVLNFIAEVKSHRK